MKARGPFDEEDEEEEEEEGDYDDGEDLEEDAMLTQSREGLFMKFGCTFHCSLESL